MAFRIFFRIFAPKFNNLYFMKRIVWFMLALLACTETMAAPVGKERAQQLAQLFMVERGMLKIDEVSDVQATPHRAPQAQDAPVFYVFNAGENRGFVIVAGDDRADSILGYSTNGTFDEDLIPENMKAWLDGLAAEMEWLRSHPEVNGAAPLFAAASQKSNIATMLQSRWDQGAPYYNLCPKQGGRHCYTGCVATAMAQVMYYHKWPEKNLRPIPAYTTYSNSITMPELPVVSFDWDGMKNTYIGNETGEDAVARLMLYAGQAVQMDYTPTGSGAGQFAVAPAMINYFGYDEGAYNADRENYSIAQWDDLIYSELAAGRPVLYTGASMSVGHEFVCDGYKDGFFHINWGWSGAFDNYYKLSVLNPNSTSGAGAGDTPDGFPNAQSAVIGLQKPTGEPPVTRPSLPIVSRMSTTGNSLSFVFYNNTRRQQKGTAAIALEDEDGNWDVLHSATYSIPARGSKTLTIDVSEKMPEAGTYNVVPLCREDGNEDEWRRIGKPYEYMEVDAVDNSGAIEYSYIQHPVFGLKATRIEPVGRVKTGMNEMRVTLKNDGDEYNGFLAFLCGVDPDKIDYDDDNFMPNGFTTIAMEAGEETTFSFFYNVTTLKNFNILIVAQLGEDDAELIGVRNFVYYDLDLADQEVSFDPLVVRVKIHNYSETDYDSTLRAVIYYNNKKGGQLDKKQLIPAGGETEFVYDTFNLSGDGVYILRFQYQQGEADPSFVTIEDYVEIDMSIVGIREMNTDAVVEKDLWFTPSGVKTKEPSTHGLFIHNGKIVVR